jgi:predicted DNA-binding transcriptional regulator AlpA
MVRSTIAKKRPTAGKEKGNRKAGDQEQEEKAKAKDGSQEQPDSLMDQDQAAKFLNMKPSTLTTWRALRKGPRFLKIGRSVRYRREDLVEFAEGGIVEPLVEMN